MSKNKKPLICTTCGNADIRKYLGHWRCLSCHKIFIDNPVDRVETIVEEKQYTLIAENKANMGVSK